MNYPKINKNFDRHFLRGYFDGDGCIRIKSDKRYDSKLGDMRIVDASINMLEDISKKMHENFNVSINKIYGPKNKNYKYIGWPSMNDIKKIYEGFYNDSTIFLKRKYDIFNNVIEIINKKNKYRKK